MSKAELLKEHQKLVPLLQKGNRPELKKEATKQRREMVNYMAS